MPGRRGPGNSPPPYAAMRERHPERSSQTWLWGMLMVALLAGGAVLFWFWIRLAERRAEEAEAERLKSVEIAVTNSPVSLFVPLTAKQGPTPVPEKPRTFAISTLCTGLKAPDGLAVQPRSGLVYVSLEDAAQIVVLADGPQVAIDRGTPIYKINGGKKTKDEPLSSPEGIAFSHTGTELYVVEDRLGGRLLRFAQTNGLFAEGIVVELPGGWVGYAWEDVDVGPKGELLVAGSNVEYAKRSQGLPFFSGVLLYRDTRKTWWAPVQQMFSSFSSVAFSKTGKQAVYTCEISGEVAWLDLTSRRQSYGTFPEFLQTPEGICSLPDGTLLVAEEGGSITALDPGRELRTPVATQLGMIESVVWDDAGKRILVTSDGRGTVDAITPAPLYPSDKDAMGFATYHPSYTPRHIPEKCPDYLARVLRMAGVHFIPGVGPDQTFSAFASRIPLIAADARATLEPPDEVADDPVQSVQFVVFFPNVMALSLEQESRAPLALFSARTASGKWLATTTLKVESYFIPFSSGVCEPFTLRHITLPQAGSVDVSASGAATVQLMGMGRGPDYSLIINPRNPKESFMLVHLDDGRIIRYRLEPPEGSDENAWVMSVSGESHNEWVRLGKGEG